MIRGGLSHLFAAALIAYLIADVAAVSGGLDTLGRVIAVVAIAGAFAVMWAMRGASARGSRAVSLMGLAGGLTLVPITGDAPLLLSAQLSTLVGQSLLAALCLDLAARVPDQVPRLAGRTSRMVLHGGIAVVAVAALASAGAPPGMFGPDVIVPATLARWPTTLLGLSIAGSLLLRLGRRRGGSSPAALASNTWGVLGLVPALLCIAWLLAARRGWIDAGAIAPRAVWTALAVVLGVGHLRMVDPTERVRVGHATRTVVTASISVGGVCAMALLIGSRVGPQVDGHGAAQGAFLALWAVAAMAAGLLLTAFVAPIVRVLLAPAGGLLLDGIARAQAEMPRARHIERLVEAMLQPLREASRDPDSVPVLFTFSPDRAARIDAAGRGYLASGALSPVLLQHLKSQPGEIVLRAPLEALAVREPTLRPLIDALVEIDALCVVPLVLEGELEGVLVIPRGLRRSTLTLEELNALSGFAAAAVASLASLLAEARAQDRSGAALVTQGRNDERIEQLEDEIARLRGDARVLRAGRAADRARVKPVTYSRAMRRLSTRLQTVATTDAPVALVAEGGTPVESLAYQVHERSGRGDQAFVVADCSAVSPGDCSAALFGQPQEGQPGWLRLAAEGTLVLLDVVALPLDVQAALAEAIASRRACSGGGEAFDVTTRVVATTRNPLDVLEAAGHLEPELAARLGAATLDVPPLRQREEDFESLMLLALDRASRIHGRDTVGIDAAAKRVLMRHDWPGNQRELQSVIDRAVAACGGERVTVEDLPPLASEAPKVAQLADPLAGTLEATEKRALERALAAAGGNKSEAARSLGLKRTTFLDKLRRHKLEAGTPERESLPPN